MPKLRYLVEVFEDDSETLYAAVYEHNERIVSGSSTTMITSGRFPALSDVMDFAGTEIAALMGDHWY